MNITDNYQHMRIHQYDSILCDEIVIFVNATNGSEEARIFEVRVY